jgi:outer membrane receptor protein involved in Fe transport
MGERVPEEARQLEIGAKAELLGGKAFATAAIYHLEKDNIAIPDETGLTRRIGDQRSRGLELELAAAPAEGWRLSVSYALNDAELTRFAEQVVVAIEPYTVATLDRSGNDPAFAPRHLLGLWASRRLESGLTLGAGARYVGRQYVAEDNAFALDDYLLLDALLSYGRGPWRLSLNFENLTGSEYETRGFGRSSVIPGDPFTLSAKLELDLGSE